MDYYKIIYTGKRLKSQLKFKTISSESIHIPDYLNIELKNKSTLDPFLRRFTYVNIELLDVYMTDNIDLLTHEYNVIFRTC